MGSGEAEMRLNELPPDKVLQSRRKEETLISEKKLE